LLGRRRDRDAARFEDAPTRCDTSAVDVVVDAVALVRPDDQVVGVAKRERGIELEVRRRRDRNPVLVEHRPSSADA
jgi:hypothetical protein